MKRFKSLTLLISLATTLSYSGSVAAYDPLNPGSIWTTKGGTAGMMYFKLPFHASEAKDVPHYGLSLRSQPTSVESSTLRLTFDSPSIMDLRFQGGSFNDFRLANQSLVESRYGGPDGRQLNFLEDLEPAEWALLIAGTAAAIWGIAELADSDDVDDPDPD